MISDDDNDGQMIFGDLGGPEASDICLTGEEKPRKNLTQETCPHRGSNPGPLKFIFIRYTFSYDLLCLNVSVIRDGQIFSGFSRKMF